MSSRIYGIDLGTTYSCIGFVDENGKPVVVQNFEGDLTTPSAVYFESPDNIIVGKEAKNVAKLDPDRVVEFVKRDMGNPGFNREINGVSYKPEVVSSYILRKLVEDASQSPEIGEKIIDVVITVPAYFGNSERAATINAGELAGLNVKHILNEPTAAAICYGLDKSRDDQIVLVYDLGGGTFDITVIAMKSGSVEVIVTGGNHHLGGKDWDNKLTEYLAAQFEAEHPDKGNPLDDKHSEQELLKTAEEAKKSLTARERYPLFVTHAGERVRVELTREKFEEVSRDLLEQTITLTKSLLQEASEKGYDKIDQILLVGGSSKMPSVGRRIAEEFGIEQQLFEPDLAVAKGAAVAGSKILVGELIKEVVAASQGVNKDEIDLSKLDDKMLGAAIDEVVSTGGTNLRLPGKDLADLVKKEFKNVCSKGFGVVALDENRDKFVSFLIRKNTPIPTEVTVTEFGTLDDNQSDVNIEVMEQLGRVESNSMSDKENKLIGNGMLVGLPPNLPAGSPIHVTFRLGEDGVLFVKGLEPTSGKSLDFEIKVEGVMTQEEVEKLKGLVLKHKVS